MFILINKLKRQKMKKTLFIALIMIFTLGAATTFASKTELKSVEPVATENRLSAEEVSRLTKRIEEIRDIDKSTLTVIEKRELRKELKGIKEKIRNDGGYVYIGAGTLILIIILIILLV
jgi:hypothetical protein